MLWLGESRQHHPSGCRSGCPAGFPVFCRKGLYSTDYPHAGRLGFSSFRPQRHNGVLDTPRLEADGNDPNYLSNITEGYSYNPIYELTQVVKGGSTSESYSYDAVGNRLSSFSVPSYSYNPSNELTSNSSGSYTYDNNGNTLTDASGKSYTWDFENRLIQAIVPGTGTTTFNTIPSVDASRRVRRWATNYLYDGKNLIEELDGSGNVLARYAFGPGLDQPLSMHRHCVIVKEPHAKGQIP